VISQAHGIWGTAIEVPGTAALNLGYAEITSVSCARAGDCSAGGLYTDSSGVGQAFVVSQAHGIWGTAIEVPGTGALNQDGSAEITSVSCARAGNCSAGGYYTGDPFSEAFVVSQVHGIWGTAIEVPGTDRLNEGGFAEITSVSCARAGNCSAGGTYNDPSGLAQAFVVSQVHGTWGTAIEVPNPAALSDGLAVTSSVSCARAGDCSAGGLYTEPSGRVQAFVINQVHGTWGTAIEVPGTAALNQGGTAEINSVSCTRPGDCSAGGHYVDSSDNAQAFVVSQVHGTWGTAIEVPGTAALNQGGLAVISSVSCARAGNCSVGGFYTDSSGVGQAFVVSQAHGTWGTAIEVPGTAALNQAGFAVISSVSCGRAGDCSAGGYYTDTSFHTHAFLVSQVHGTWGTAFEVPGTAP